MGTGLTGGCELPSGCWGPDLGLLQRQQVLLAPESSLQPHYVAFCWNILPQQHTENQNNAYVNIHQGCKQARGVLCHALHPAFGPGNLSESEPGRLLPSLALLRCQGPALLRSKLSFLVLHLSRGPCGRYRYRRGRGHGTGNQPWGSKTPL